MTSNKKIGIIVDKDFSTKHSPPYPHPTFLSYESPMRIDSIITYLEKKRIFEDNRVVRLKPKSIGESVLHLAHTKYYMDSIKHLSNLGNGLLGEEVFITEDTHELAKKAVGGAIQAIEEVIKQNVNQSFALIRPPGHHALREIGAGFCIFNNIANSVIYLRKRLQFHGKIAIIDIDAHFGDGLVQYFYDDPSVLYFSVHEYDYIEGDIGFINEIGDGEGLGKSINFPLPLNSTDADFLEIWDILEPVLKEFSPELIIVAAGFDMYYDDPVGNNLLTSISYYNFTQRIIKLAEELCNGKLAFILEGGYSLIGLPTCVYSVMLALLREAFEPSSHEHMNFRNFSKKNEIAKVKLALKKLLTNYWSSID